MRLTRCGFFLCVALLSTTSASAARTSDFDRRTLAVVQSRPLLEHACGNVALSIAKSPVRTAASDASVAALRSFVFSGRSVNVRAWCLRNARDLVRLVPSSAYVADLDDLENALLGSTKVNDQLVGARGAWGDYDLRAGRPMLRLTLPDRPASVRIAALKNLYWAMVADVYAHGDGKRYERAIARALSDRDDRVVTAGLLACAMLHQASAGATLLAYVRNRDPAIRAGVYEALSGREVIDGTDSRLFAIGLRDPDIRVRSAALIALRMPTRADLRLLALFARHAPTPQDRRNAQDQLSAFRGFKPFV